MAFTMDGTVAVITGASSGIGRATALELARRGATVALAARREEALERLVRECEDAGGHALAIPVDVTDADAVDALARRAAEAFGRIDVWVNNAAVTAFGRVEDIPADAFRRVIETNLFGYVHGARAVLPWFREQGGGVLINVSSVVGRLGQPYTGAYTISKFAIIGLSDVLRQELRDEPGIAVVSILPGSIDTPLFQHGANFMGWAARPVPPVYTAGRVARVIVSAARSPRREIVVGPSARGALLIRALAPALLDRLAPRVIRRRHFQDRVADGGPGNLFEPSSGHASVDGGWRAQDGNGRSRTPWLVLAGLAGLGVGLGLSARRR